MALTQQFNLDMIPQTIPVVVPVNQYDTGTGRLIIKLYRGSNPYSPSNATVKIQGTKPDRKGFQYNATISGNTVTANLEEQMTACYGDVRTQVVVTESTGKTGTFVFLLRVQKSALQDDVDISETVLPEYISGAQTAAQEAAQSAQDASNSAQTAEEWAYSAMGVVGYYPYIDETTSHWMVFDIYQYEWVDTGISADGSTTSYSSLLNKPQIEGVELNGDKSLYDLGINEYLEDTYKYANDKVKDTVGFNCINIFNPDNIQVGKDYDGSSNINKATIVIPLDGARDYRLKSFGYNSSEYDWEEEIKIYLSQTIPVTSSSVSHWMELPADDFGGWKYLIVVFNKASITKQDIIDLQMVLYCEGDYQIYGNTYLPYQSTVMDKFNDFVSIQGTRLIFNPPTVNIYEEPVVSTQDEI